MVHHWRLPHVGLVLIVGLLLTTPLAALAASRPIATTYSAQQSLQQEFAAAAAEFNVPESVLLGVGYMFSRWEHHAERPSNRGGYGIMHLTDVDWQAGNARGLDVLPSKHPSLAELQTLNTAARLINQSPAALKRERVLNIRGGAALLAEYGQATSAVKHDPATWYGAVVQYSGFRDAQTAYDFADVVYEHIQNGLQHQISTGERVSLAAQPVQPQRDSAAQVPLQRAPAFDADCPPELDCDVIPAAYEEIAPGNYGNYDLADRPVNGLPIRYIVIHDTEISYDLTLQVFQNPQTKAATHYVIRSSDGQIAQMIENEHVGWHAGNWYINGHSIGIEHEGVAIEGAAWYTEYMYHASARLVRYLASKYGLPLDRAHIVGHDELPGPTQATHTAQHWDPGPFWDWNHYMELVRGPQAEPERIDPDIVTISPNFSTHMPPLTYCYAANDCREVATQPANFVYLRTTPVSATDNYVTDTLVPDPDPLHANNWANKAVTGQQFYRVAQTGDWDAIYFSGQVAWMYNPDGMHTRPGSGLLITPRAGLETIPVYGRAYPEAEAYPADVPVQSLVPLYEMPAGQVYVAAQEVQSTYYRAPTYIPAYDPAANFPVIGQTTYYQIYYNHRFAFVKSSDVEVVSSPATLGLELEPAEATQTAEAGAVVTHTLTLTNTDALSATFWITATETMWSTSVSTNTVELAPQASTTLTVSVAIPADTENVRSDTVHLWVRRADIAERVALATRTTALPEIIEQWSVYLPVLLNE